MEVTDEQRKKLEAAYRNEKSAKLKIRYLSLVYMFVDGMTVEETSRLLRLGTTVVQQYRSRYQKGGVKSVGVIGHSPGCPSYLSEGQKASIKDTVANGEFRTSQSVCDWVDQQWGDSIHQISI